MDSVLRELKETRENVEERLNALLQEAEALHARGNKALDEDDDAFRDYTRTSNDLLAKIIGGLRDVIALNNARCAELTRQLTILPAKRTDIMIETLEKRIETLESNLLREKNNS